MHDYYCFLFLSIFFFFQPQNFAALGRFLGYISLHQGRACAFDVQKGKWKEKKERKTVSENLHKVCRSGQTKQRFTLATCDVL